MEDILERNKCSIVGYIRTACKENAIISIEQQRNIINKYCSKYNVKLQHLFIDIGYSGLGYNRPGFQKIINSDKYKVILVSDTSRIGRNVAKGIEIIQEKNKIFIAIDSLIVI